MPHQKFMAQASHLATHNMLAGEGGPFGCIIVKDGEVIAEGWNRVTSTNDPTAHAEMVAIRRACEKLGVYHLEGATLYTSCEPCPMCLAAIYWAHIDTVYYANTRVDAAQIGFDDNKIYEELNWPIADRTMPMHRLECDKAVESFKLWEAKMDKAAY